jgi:hypothetical protein
MTEFLYRARPWATTLIEHNWPLLLYGLAIAVVAVWAYVTPGRRVLLILYGLLGLAFAFEYQKHIAPALIDSARYLFSVEVNPRPRAISQFIVGDVLPVALHGIAVAFLVVAALPRCWSGEEIGPGPRLSRR